MFSNEELNPETRAELAERGVPEEHLGIFGHHGLGTLIPKLDIRFHEFTRDQVVASMPVEGNTQPAGLLHGGASAALLETVGSFAAALAASSDQMALGTELNITHLRSGSSGRVTATATPIKLGRTQCVHSIEIVGENGKTISVGRMTNMLVPRPPQAAADSQLKAA